MAAQSAFWDRLADRYAAQPVADQAAYESKLAATRQLLRPDMDVFEFGCGTGSTALIHASHVRHVRAVDFSARMVEIAQEKAGKAGANNVSFEQGSIESVDLVPGSFDMVMGHSILHLLKDKRAAIARSHEALRPGGYFVTSTACLGDMMPLIRFVAPIGNRLGLLPHLDVMTAAQLRHAIEMPGFVVEQQWQPTRKAAVFIIARKPERVGPV
jgi:ubiquinone/menaquinone biosynthesis C-methylase UbiE